jgi:hypothetical protein
MASRNATSDPIGEASAEIGLGAVLYDARPPERRDCCRKGGRCLHHVTGVYRETTTGETLVEVQDGTHTTRSRFHKDDVVSMFELAGWSIDPTVKPTYILTRVHGVDDHHDRMTASE